MAEQPRIEVVLKRVAFKKRVRSYIFKNLGYKDLLPFFTEAERIFIEKTREVLLELPNVKSNFLLEAKFIRPKIVNDNGKEVEASDFQVETFYLLTKMKPISPTTTLKNWFKKNMMDVMGAKVDQIQEYGSGWSLHEIVSLEVNYNKFVRFSGTSYLPLPKSIKNKRAVINVKNNDNQCFKWAVLSALYPAEDHVDRLSKYERFQNELNFENISFPVSLNDISTFETQNPTISINVYIIQKEYDINTKKNKNMLVPIRLTKEVKTKHIHMLLLFESDNEEFDIDVCNANKSYMNKVLHDDLVRTHYAWIKNLSAMIQGQVTKIKRNKKFICDRCLHFFYTQQKLDNHIMLCTQMNECKITLPDENNRWLSFKNYKNEIEVPFIIYADIESLLVPEVSNDEESEMTTQSSTPNDATQRHIANSIGYYFHARIDPSLSHYETFFGPDCIPKFIDRLKDLMIDIVWPKLHEVKPMNLTVQEEENFKNASICHICNKSFKSQKIMKKYAITVT